MATRGNPNRESFYLKRSKTPSFINTEKRKDKYARVDIKSDNSIPYGIAKKYTLFCDTGKFEIRFDNRNVYCIDKVSFYAVQISVWEVPDYIGKCETRFPFDTLTMLCV